MLAYAGVLDVSAGTHVVLGRWMLALTTLVGASGCGDSHRDTPHHGQDIGCRDDARALTFGPDLSVPSESGRLRFVLVEAHPAPPARDLNRWTVQVWDGDIVVSDVPMTVAAWMPDHGHGPPRAPNVTADGDRFVIDDIDLFMAGLWRITLTVETDVGSDRAQYHFCIEG